MNDHKKYIVFGAGEIGRLAIDILGVSNISFFIDNSKSKQGTMIEGLKIISLDKAVSLMTDETIAIAVSTKYVDEIITQLASRGIYNYISIHDYIYKMRKRRLLERHDRISDYTNAIKWIEIHAIDNKGMAISSSERIIYPEVTGYYIPSLLRWGYRDLAISFATYLISIQRHDGGWNGPHDEKPYIFDTGQVIKGLLEVVDFVPDALRTAKKGADWIISNMNNEGRLNTPSSDEWGKDETVCSDLVHIYCLSPLADITRLTGDTKYKEAAEKILNYYLENHIDRILEFKHLSHFHAYLMEALLDMGRDDVAKKAMKEMEKYQKDNGSVPAYNNCDWVCSTGLFQLALVWYRLGDIDRANKAFSYACGLQNESGGWYGSYLSEDNEKAENTYFPLSEISWANKYFLDALYYKNKAEFDLNASIFMDTISFEDGRYITIKKVISELQEKHGRLTIADIGCGKARYLKNLIKDFPDNAYYGVDISRRVLEYSDSSLFHLSEGTLTSIPFSDGLFDVVYTSEALEHAIDINSSIREMSRVTKSGGLIIIIDKDREVLGRFEINEWEQWFDRDGLKDIMLKYCSDVYTMNEISYDDMPADGLFCAWIGEVK